MNLVTGATGHIGNVLVRELLSNGKEVRALILPGEDLTPLEGLAVDRVEGDVLDSGSLRKAFDGAGTVYHLAGIISILPGKNDRRVYRVNVGGTQNVVSAALQAGVRRLVYTSSIHAIPRAPHGVTIDEAMAFEPGRASSAYDRSKAEASLAVLKAVQAGLPAVIACPTGVIGPYDFRRSEMGQLILDCMHKQFLFCVDGAYDFVDVRDVAQGLILAGEKGRVGETYILAGEQISISHLMETVQEISGSHSPRFKVPIRLAQQAASLMQAYYRLTRNRPLFTSYSLATVTGNSVISSAKARRELGYQARSIRASIADSVHWFLANRRMSLGAIRG